LLVKSTGEDLFDDDSAAVAAARAAEARRAASLFFFPRFLSFLSSFFRVFEFFRLPL